MGLMDILWRTVFQPTLHNPWTGMLLHACCDVYDAEDAYPASMTSHTSSRDDEVLGGRPLVRVFGLLLS